MKKINTALASLVVIAALGSPAFALQDPKPQQTQPAPTDPVPAASTSTDG